MSGKMSRYRGADVKTLSNFRPDACVARILVDALRKNGDAIALIEGQTGKSASFKNILQQSSFIAAGLRSAGLSAGDCVIICCDKSILSYCLVFGAIFTGATVVLPPIPHADIVHKLTRGHSIKAVICDPMYFDTLSASLKQMASQPSMVITTDKVMSTLGKSPSTEDFVIYEPKDVRKHVSMIFFSSGTTGDPKGIQLTDVAVQLIGEYFQHKFKTFMVASPLYWLSALFPVLSGFWYNFTIVLNNSRETKENLELIQKYKVDAWFTSVGSMSRYVYEPALKNYDLSSVKRAFVAGEYVLGSVAEKFMRTVLDGRVRLGVVYGSTEAGMISSFNDDQETDQVRTGECGKLYPGVEMKILDDDGKVVPVGTLGRVWIKTVAVTPGYWGRPDLNKGLFDKEGFYESGDTGFFDKDFNLFLRGRMGDIINYKGIKIAPGETEDVLLAHEDVLDGAVVGHPHETDGQHMTAFVELRPGAKVTGEQLTAYVNEKVDDLRKLKGGVHVIDVLPRTVIGKILRKQLREIKV